MELAFQAKYGQIVEHLWFDEGYIMLGGWQPKHTYTKPVIPVVSHCGQPLWSTLVVYGVPPTERDVALTETTLVATSLVACCVLRVVFVGQRLQARVEQNLEIFVKFEFTRE